MIAVRLDRMSITRRRVPGAPKQRRRALRATVVAVVIGTALASCSIMHDESAKVPPPVTRDVSDVTTTSVAGSGTGTGIGDAAGPTSLPVPPPLTYTIAWEPVDDRTDVGTITVPVDYDDPQGATLDLRVARHQADPDHRIGVLATNNGGPGSAASSMALNAASWFPSEITDQFDVVSWDPRGTGASGASVDCIDDSEFDRFFGEPDLTPDDEAERQMNIDTAKEFAEGCVDRVHDLTSIGTNNTARDLDAIRQALGEPQLSYFGFSYGSELGGVWATLFPSTVRAAVFDGATDPTADSLERTKDQWVGFEHALDTFLAGLQRGQRLRVPQRR